MKRYDMVSEYNATACEDQVRPVEDANGQWVRYEDAAALVATVEKLKERNRKLDVDLLRALFYAPSSPVSPDKTYEIEVWYGKFKQVHLANKRQSEVK